MAIKAPISFSVEGNNGRSTVTLKGVDDTALSLVGRGGASSVYRYAVPSGSQVAIKIFNKPERAPWQKLELLTRENNTKAQSSGANGYAIAWPLSPVTSNQAPVGIVLPFFDRNKWLPLDHWIEHYLLEKLKPETTALSSRLHILKHCAAALADLHRRNMAVVDLKPSNILVDRDSCRVAFIDIDSYRVSRSGRTYPATHISAGYILPTALGDNIDIAALGSEQDRYAFAVLVFQVLNFGIHPYQGILGSNAEEASTNDEKAKRRLYAYGQTSSANIQPLSQSVHECWPDQLRAMLDTALTQVDQAPSAQLWADYFSSILDGKQLERCPAYANDVRHIRFASLPCLACKRAEAAKKIQNHLRQNTQKSPKPPIKNGKSTAREWFEFLCGIIFIGFLLIKFIYPLIADHRNHPSPSPIPTPPPALPSVPNKIADIIADDVILYEAPAFSSKQILRTRKGNWLRVISEINGNWDEVEIAYTNDQPPHETNTHHGYILRQYLKYR